jgi:glycerate 2-kinase
MTPLATDSQAIWEGAVAAVRPADLMKRFFAENLHLRAEIAQASRIVVVGGGKAGGSMAEALEAELEADLDRVTGLVNVPSDAVRSLRKIRLHAARPAASNHPTADGVTGSEEMLRLVAGAGTNDVVLCLISGGGSALLPFPDGITLEEKQRLTKRLHTSGAIINEMNCVRKHLSRIKGGRLAQAFRGRSLISLILSDVIDDPLDVIASGPTVPDPSTFADAMRVLERYSLCDDIPQVVAHFRKGIAGQIPETLKAWPKTVGNHLLGNNAVALEAALQIAQTKGYRVITLGSGIQGETVQAASAIAGRIRELRRQDGPWCLLFGGETTVTLGSNFGKGGRNQEFVLALLKELGRDDMADLAVLSGGTDGEDGPTDAAGAIVDSQTWSRIDALGLDVDRALIGHDAYPLFDALGALLKPGLTETNVMDLGVICCTGGGTRGTT